MIKLAHPASARSSNLAITLLGLPASRRADALLFFRFCRAVDDIADDAGLQAAEKTARLGEWLTAIDSGSGLPPELDRVIRAHELDRSLLRAVVEGCLRDAGPVRMETIDELRGYCWQVACAVGIASSKIFGCRSPEAPAFAVHLGYALQFTNICRDVAEDAALDRIYIPGDLLHRHGASGADIIAGKDTPQIADSVAELAGLAAGEFCAARESFPPTDANALRPAATMAAIYARILMKIRSHGFRLSGPRIRLSKIEKLALLATGLVAHPQKMLAFADL